MTSLVYSTGTVSVSNGSATVIGAGSAWTTALVRGGVFSCAGLAVPIVSVNSDTSLTLAYPWPGTAGAGKAYAIARETSEAISIAWTNTNLANVIARLSLVGIHPDGSGTLAERDALDPPLATGKFWLHAEPGVAFAFYRKVASGWEGPFPVEGEGPEGPIGPMGPDGDITWEGAWLTATTYTENQAISFGGSSYVCIVSHTSGTFATDLAAGKWELMAAKGDKGDKGDTGAPGANGTGTGDVVGPASSADNALARFNGTTGKLLKAGGAIATGEIADDGVTNAKLANVPTATFKGRSTAGAGDPEDLSMSAAMALLVAAGLSRDTLTADRTYYVRTDGSNSNTGLANTAGGAFLTIQKAWDTVCGLDLSVYTATIQIANGTYTAGLISSRVPVGVNPVIIQGNSASPTSVVVSGTNASDFSFTGPAHVTIKDMRLLTTTSGDCIEVNHPGAKVQFENIIFAACAGNHLRCDRGDLRATGSYSIIAAAVRHILVGAPGLVSLGGITVTLTGTPAFSQGFITVQSGGVLSLFSVTFSGAATGRRYSVSSNSVINSFGAGTASTYFPGNTDGVATTGGVQI